MKTVYRTKLHGNRTLKVFYNPFPLKGYCYYWELYAGNNKVLAQSTKRYRCKAEALDNFETALCLKMQPVITRESNKNELQFMRIGLVLSLILNILLIIL